MMTLLQRIRHVVALVLISGFASPAAGQLFENVRASSGEPVSAGVLLVGEKYHIDRDYTITSLPDFLVGAAFIKTANDDKFATDEEHLFFDLTETASIFVGYDSRVTVLPAWLENFLKIDETVGTTDTGTDFELYVIEDVPPGPYTLGANLAPPAAGPQTNYIVIAVTGEGGGGGLGALFVADDLTGPVPHTVNFDASRSTETGANIASFDWDFGDGTTGTGQMVSHTYTEVGAYRVKLTVTDDQGATAENAEYVVYAGSTVGQPDDPLLIARTEAAPVVDGEVDAEYGATQSTHVFHNNGFSGAIGIENDLSADARLLWDDENIYVLLEILDDSLKGSDDVAVYFDGNNDKTISEDGNDLNLTGLRWNEAAVVGLPEGVVYAVGTTDIGYNIEMSVPWSLMGVSPAVDHQIGFEVRMTDQDDDKEVVFAQMAWYAYDGTARDPSLYGTARLAVAGAVASENSAELPEGFSIESVYPNPFNPTTNVIVRIAETGSYRLAVYDLLGRRVVTREVGPGVFGQVSVPLDLSGRPSGVYLVSLENRTTGSVVHATAILLK